MDSSSGGLVGSATAARVKGSWGFQVPYAERVRREADIMSMAVGLIIDDAIVVVENIVLHRDSGQSRGEAIRSARLEIRVPLIGSTITPIVVFLPLVSITGVTGSFFRALALTFGPAPLPSPGLPLPWPPTPTHHWFPPPRDNSPGARLPLAQPDPTDTQKVRA